MTVTAWWKRLHFQLLLHHSIHLWLGLLEYSLNTLFSILYCTEYHRWHEFKVKYDMWEFLPYIKQVYRMYVIFLTSLGLWNQCCNQKYFISINMQYILHHKIFILFARNYIFKSYYINIVMITKAINFALNVTFNVWYKC